MESSNIKSFYRQEKKTTKKKKKNGGNDAIAKLSSMIGSDLAPVLLSSLNPKGSTKELSGEVEERLREFDMDMRYGPSVGLTRMERWDRASVMGLFPPADLESLLLTTSVTPHCLWQGWV